MEDFVYGILDKFSAAIQFSTLLKFAFELHRTLEGTCLEFETSRAVTTYLSPSMFLIRYHTKISKEEVIILKNFLALFKVPMRLDFSDSY